MPQIKRKQNQSYQDRIIEQIEELPDYHNHLFAPWEHDIIRKYYPSKGAKGLSKILKKSTNQLRHRASSLGVRLSDE